MQVFLAVCGKRFFERPCCINRTEVATPPFSAGSDHTLIGRAAEVGHAVDGFDGDLSFGGSVANFAELFDFLPALVTSAVLSGSSKE